MENDVQI
jgi:hypothetical protein